MILGFVDYETEVKQLTSLMSHNTRNYYKAHKMMLSGFIRYMSPITKQTIFNDYELTYKRDDVVHFEYPTRIQ